MTGYVDDFSCHPLGAGVLSWCNWRPSTGARPYCANSAHEEEVERPEEAWAEEQAAEKRGATQMENEEDCWAGVGMDDGEKPLPGISVRTQRWGEI